MICIHDNNRTDPRWILSGSDDSHFSVWDISSVRTDKPVATKGASIRHHRGQITSVSWHPTERDILAVAGEDDVVSIWDLGVEHDQELAKDPTLAAIPQNLLFEHQVRYHIMIIMI